MKYKTNNIFASKTTKRAFTGNNYMYQLDNS